MPAQSTQTVAAKANEIIFTRTVQAPIQRVWHMFTQPEHFKYWWGPNGFTNLRSQCHVRFGVENAGLIPGTPCIRGSGHDRVMQAMLKMTTIVIADLQRAYDAD